LRPALFRRLYGEQNMDAATQCPGEIRSPPRSIAILKTDRLNTGKPHEYGGVRS